MRTEDIRSAIRASGLSAKAVCIHASFRSFGAVIEGGPQTVVKAFVDENCTVMVPSFTYDYMLVSQAGMQPQRNAWPYGTQWENAQPRHAKVFAPGDDGIHESMGAIARSVANMPGRARGNHPLMSFSAIGTKARFLVESQQPMDAMAPLRLLANEEGYIVLMGVDLNRMTALHYAEKVAGRNLFLRWANGPEGKPIYCEFGGCSDGFLKFKNALAQLEKTIVMGKSVWKIFPARETIEAAAKIIRENPEITHCGNPKCERCNDAVQGGVIYPFGRRGAA